MSAASSTRAAAPSTSTRINNNGGIFNFSDFYLGQAAGSSQSYDLESGTLTTNNEFIGFSGTGIFTQSGGTNAPGGNLTLAANTGSSGSYTMTGGSLGVTGNTVVGSGAAGTFTQDNSAADSYHSVGGSLILGAQAGGSGSYSLTDTGTGNAVSLTVTGDTIVGDAGSGTFTQSGDASVHTTTNLILGNQSGGSGTYNLKRRQPVRPQPSISGVTGTGSFTQSGGTNTVTIP